METRRRRTRHHCLPRAGCAGIGSRASSGILAVLAAPLLAHAQAPTVLKPCEAEEPGGAVRCATVEVPEDHGDPGSRRLGLHVVVVPAEGPERKPDPVFLLSGGPGQAATDIAAFMARRPPELRSRDVVLVDQRGTGRSNPLSCPLAKSLDQHFGGIFAPDPVLRACLADVSRRADPGLYTTTQTAHDLDVVRRALGYERVNLSGASYGTRLALEYLRRYPAAVRTVTVEGVAPVDFRAPLEYARFAQEALDALFADCRADAECSRAFPRLEEAWTEVLDRLRARPARVTLTDGDGSVAARYGAYDFAYTVRTMLYGPQALRIPRMIDDAWRTDDFTALADLYARRAERLWPALSLGLHLSVFCAEDVPFISDEDVEAFATGTYLGTYVIDEYRRGCRIWPRGEIPGDFREPVRSDAPVLILSGRRDPSTPPATGERVARYLPSAVHLVHPWGGHGFSGTTDDACEAAARETLLRTGSTATVDVDCAAEASPLPFRISADGEDDVPAQEAGEDDAFADVRAAETTRMRIPVLTDIDLDTTGRRLTYVQGRHGIAVGQGADRTYRDEVDQRRPVNPGEARSGQLLLERRQGAADQMVLFGVNHHVGAGRLDPPDLGQGNDAGGSGGLQEEAPPPRPRSDARCRRTGASDVVRPPEPHRLSGAIESFVKALVRERLENVVDRPDLEGLDGVLLVGGDDDEHRRVPAQLPIDARDDLEAAHPRHADVEKDDVRPQLPDLVDGPRTRLGIRRRQALPRARPSGPAARRSG